MIRFEFLESLGNCVAVMSDKANGDCSSSEPCRMGRERFLTQANIRPNQLIRVKQVHETAIHTVSPSFLENYSSENPLLWPEGDGLISNLPGFALGISVADCVPLLIVDPQKHAIGAFHAGRKGTVAGMAKAAVNSLTREFASSPENLFCIIGPSAGPCCYELSVEMAEEHQMQGLPVYGRKLDLWELNRRHLIEAGVPEEHIEITRLCTVCGTEFFSYRKHQSAERNLALLMWGGSL